MLVKWTAAFILCCLLLLSQTVFAKHQEHMAAKEINAYLSEVESYLNNLGEDISDFTDMAHIQSVLSKTYRADKAPIDPIGTSYVSFANDDGFIVVSGKLGVLEQKDHKDIAKRSYFEVAKQDDLGRLKFASYEMSLFKGGQVFPTLMKIQDTRGRVGYLVLGLRTSEFMQRIKQRANLSKEAQFVFPDGNSVR